MDQQVGPTEKSNTEEDVIMSPQAEDNQNQKNLILAGVALQARHSASAL